MTELGYEIVEVEFAKKYNGDNLTVFIDKKEGYIDITDCEKVHNAIDEPLDELDPTMGKPYTLNVSSPGIDRPIVTDKDYNRNLGEVLEVKLFQAIQKKKIFIGKLLSFDETNRWHQEEYWPLIFFPVIFAIVWGAFVAGSIIVGRNPKKFSKKVIKLFFKDGYVKY